jgi:hypothetical protein
MQEFFWKLKHLKFQQLKVQENMLPATLKKLDSNKN